MHEHQLPCRYLDRRLGACLVTVFELANPMPVLGSGTSLASCINPIVDANMRDCVFAGHAAAAPVIPLWAVTRPQSLFPDACGAAPATIEQAEPDLRWVVAQVSAHSVPPPNPPSPPPRLACARSF